VQSANESTDPSR